MLPFLRRVPAGVFFALGLLAAFACKSSDTRDDEEDDNQFREDVIQCEEAIARLERCCPDFDPSRVICNYYYSYDTSACGPTTEQSVRPALELGESRCIRDTSCDQLVATGVCGRAQEARAYSQRLVLDDGDASTDQKQSHPPVCP